MSPGFEIIHGLLDRVMPNAEESSGYQLRQGSDPALLPIGSLPSLDSTSDFGNLADEAQRTKGRKDNWYSKGVIYIL